MHDQPMSHCPMTLPDLVIATQAYPHSHTSSFVELSDGRVIHTSYGIINCSDDGGLTWTEPKRIYDANGDEVFAISVVKLPEKNSLGIVGQLKEKPHEHGWATMGGEGVRYYVFYRSDDLGQTWSVPSRITAPGFFPVIALQDSAIVTSTGRIVVPMFFQALGVEDQPMPWTGKLVRGQWGNVVGHHFDKGITMIIVCYSDDGGRTWKKNSEGSLFVMQDMNSICRKVNEPSVTEIAGAPGRLLMIMRTHLGRLYQSWSNDNGETWCEPQPTLLASTSAPAQIRTLPNGHLLCIWNQQSEEEFRKGYVRTRLSSAISRDGGGIWEFFQNIESIHDSSFVAPGPIRVVRPVGLYAPPGQPAIEADPAYVENALVEGRWTYPSVGVCKDHIIVAYSCHGYLQEHETEARMFRTGTLKPDVNTDKDKVNGQRRKILPLKWFYGGREPVDLPFEREYVPARP